MPFMQRCRIHGLPLVKPDQLGTAAPSELRLEPEDAREAVLRRPRAILHKTVQICSLGHRTFEAGPIIFRIQLTETQEIVRKRDLVNANHTVSEIVGICDGLHDC